MSKEKDVNRRDFLKKMGYAGAAGLGSMALGRRSWGATDIEGGKEVTAVDNDEKGGELNLFVWNGYDADGVLNPFALNDPGGLQKHHILCFQPQ